MSLESRLIKPINYFRTSPHPFEVQGVEDISFTKNPEKNINPLGGPVPELRLFVVSDTHWHVSQRVSYDRTASLPTTHLASLVRRVGLGQNVDWHKNTRPFLYNHSLNSWPSAVRDFLNSSYLDKLNYVLCVHAGDVGDDSLNQSELGEALFHTDMAMAAIANEFGSTTPDAQVQSIQLLGDHDADMRAWVKGGKTRQIQWFYDRKGIDALPACYLQEIGIGEEPIAGVLMLDTNLLNDEWVEKVKQSAYESIKEPSFSYSFFDEALNNEELKQFIYSFGRDASIYDEVRDKARLQKELIQRAGQLKDLVLVGHIPRYLKPVAETMSGKVTIIAGHRHILKHLFRKNI